MAPTNRQYPTNFAPQALHSSFQIRTLPFSALFKRSLLNINDDTELAEKVDNRSPKSKPFLLLVDSKLEAELFESFLALTYDWMTNPIYAEPHWFK